jgi:hypothetical protein
MMNLKESERKRLLPPFKKLPQNYPGRKANKDQVARVFN